MSYSRPQQHPHWLDPKWHPAPGHVPLTVKDKDGAEFTAYFVPAFWRFAELIAPEQWWLHEAGFNVVKIDPPAFWLDKANPLIY